MLSNKRVEELRELFGLEGAGYWVKGFAEAIEREATATLIEQITKDEVLMRQAAQVISWHCFGDCRAFGGLPIPLTAEVVDALRQRLEAKK